jgi:hypothetical protein
MQPQQKNPLVLASSGEVSKQLSYLYICSSGGFYAERSEIAEKKGEMASTKGCIPFLQR